MQDFVQNINVMPGYVVVNNKSMIYPLVELKSKIKFKFKILLVNSKLINVLSLFKFSLLLKRFIASILLVIEKIIN